MSCLCCLCMGVCACVPVRVFRGNTLTRNTVRVFRGYTLTGQCQGVPDSPCCTVKVVEGDNGVKVHAEDLPQLDHQGRVVGGEDCHVVSGLVPAEEDVLCLHHYIETRAGRLVLESVIGGNFAKNVHVGS